MCLRIDSFYHKVDTDDTSYLRGKPKPFIADEDILVWKVLEIVDNRDFIHKVGEALFTNPNKYSLIYKTPYFGFEAEFKDGRCDMVSGLGFEDSWTIGQGIHAFTRKTDAYSQREVKNTYTIFPAYIPAGSLFYIGTSNDIVTNHLVICESFERHLWCLNTVSEWLESPDREWAEIKEEIEKSSNPLKKAYALGFEAGMQNAKNEAAFFEKLKGFGDSLEKIENNFNDLKKSYQCLTETKKHFSNT